MPDSTVAGLHYDRLQRWAAFALVSKEQRRHMAREIAVRDRLIVGLNAELTATRGAMERWQVVADTLELANKALQVDLSGCRMDAERRKPWATIGKITVGTVALGAIVGAVAWIKKEQNP